MTRTSAADARIAEVLAAVEQLDPADRGLFVALARAFVRRDEDLIARVQAALSRGDLTDLRALLA
jgi:hypothetical protein